MMMVDRKWMLGMRCSWRYRCLSENWNVARSSLHCLLLEPKDRCMKLARSHAQFIHEVTYMWAVIARRVVHKLLK